MSVGALRRSSTRLSAKTSCSSTWKCWIKSQKLPAHQSWEWSEFGKVEMSREFCSLISRLFVFAFNSRDFTSSLRSFLFIHDYQGISSQTFRKDFTNSCKVLRVRVGVHRLFKAYLRTADHKLEALDNQNTARITDQIFNYSYVDK